MSRLAWRRSRDCPSSPEPCVSHTFSCTQHTTCQQSRSLTTSALRCFRHYCSFTQAAVICPSMLTRLALSCSTLQATYKLHRAGQLRVFPDISLLSPKYVQKHASARAGPYLTCVCRWAAEH